MNCQVMGVLLWQEETGSSYPRPAESIWNLGKEVNLTDSSPGLGHVTLCFDIWKSNLGLVNSGGDNRTVG